MQTLLVGLIVVVLGVLLYMVNAIKSTSQVQQQAQPQNPPIDINALVATIRSTVEAEVRKTAAESLQSSTQQSAEFFSAQARNLDQQTRALLQPFEQHINSLSQSVSSLQTSFTSEQSTVSSLALQIQNLNSTTTSLSNMLKSPSARGSWGENQLRNVIQLAGMESFCDYSEQFTGGEGERNQRPDVVVRLPNNAFLAIDSKAVLAAYGRMSEAADAATKDAELKMHARDLRNHMKTLADKKYWEQFPSAPEFVVMFIPGEGFVSDAMRTDPTLLEDAMRQRVLIASPVNLLALLLAVAKGWQAHKATEHADEVARLGAEVYDRVGKVLELVSKMGKGIESSTRAYNELVGSIESRMLVTLRKFRELGVVQTEIDEVKQIEVATRELSAVEVPRELN
jgi:DNA recombination protein RmuC